MLSSVGFYAVIGFYIAIGFYVIAGFHVAIGIYVAIQCYLTLGFYLEYVFCDTVEPFKLAPCKLAPCKLAPFKLAICEVFNPVIHGQDENSSPGIQSQFLVYTFIELEDFYSGEYLYEVNSLRRYRSAIQIMHGAEHPSIRNYPKVTRKYMRLEIVQADVLKGGEEVAYLKTFWLRLVQRRWKKIYQARKEILKKRSGIKALQERQRTGKWPAHLMQLPTLYTNTLYTNTL